MSGLFLCPMCNRSFVTKGGRDTHVQQAHTHQMPGIVFDTPDAGDEANNNLLMFRMALRQTPSDYIVRTTPFTVAAKSCVEEHLESDPLNMLLSTYAGEPFDWNAYPLWGTYWPEVIPCTGQRLTRCDLCGKELRYHPEFLDTSAFTTLE